MKKLFFNTKMTWLKVIVLSVACGVIPGLLMVPKFLDNTSFQQPGISFEFWIFMALLIILNCQKPLEAGLKTFVFFLISQPLIYLVQVPFTMLGWQIFSYYRLWGIITLFTLPGGIIAWYTKKGNWLSVAILSVANLILCVELPMSIRSCIDSFPSYLLSTAFIIAEIILFSILLFEDKKKRACSFGIALLMILLVTIFNWSSLSKHEIVYSTEIEGTAPFEAVAEYENLDILIDGNTLQISASDYCTCIIELRDGNGETIRCNFDYRNGVLELYQMEE